MPTIVKVTAAPEWIDIPVRVDDSVALRLAMHAHEAGITLNDLMVALLDDMLKRPRVIRSRNRREGHYAGKAGGRHLRTDNPRYSVGTPIAVLAWALAGHRWAQRMTRVAPR
jgi:hypothetical protein